MPSWSAVAVGSAVPSAAASPPTDTGPAMTPKVRAALDDFIARLADNKIVLFKGPLFYQDGSLFLKDGEVATDRQIWYVKKLLEGMSGTGGDK